MAEAGDFYKVGLSSFSVGRLSCWGFCLSLECCQCSLVVGLLCYFGYQFRIDDFSFRIDNDDGTGQQTAQGAVSHQYAIFFTKTGTVAEV